MAGPRVAGGDASRRLTAFEECPLPVVHAATDGTVLDVNPALCRLVGLAEADVVGASVVRFVLPQDRHLLTAALVQRELGEGQGTFACRVRTAGGGHRWYRLTWYLHGEPGGHRWSATYLEDIDGPDGEALVEDELLAAVEEERATLNATLEASPDGMAIMLAERDAGGAVVDTRLLRMNRTGTRLLGGEDMSGLRLHDYFPEATSSGLHAALMETFRTGEARTLVIEVGAGGSRPGVFENVLVPIDADRLLCVFRDITQTRDDQLTLLHAATHDALTGLPNRTLLRDRVEHALQRTHREGGSVAVAFLDLDGFKDVNDTMGHRHGDLVLQRVAERLSASVREEDTVARLGGDEFVLVLEQCGSEQEWRPVYDRVVSALARPLVVDDHVSTVRASVGVVFATDGEPGTDELLRNADIAMYASKSSGRGRYTVYTEEHRARVVELVALETDLATALRLGQLELWFQEVHDLRLGTTTTQEALLRWRHPRRGLLMPQAFIPTAQSAGLMVEIGRWVLHESLRQVAQRRAASPDQDASVAVNVCAQELLRGDYVATVEQALVATGVPSSALVVEITESQILPAGPGVLAQLHGLRGLGVTVAVDDFGTGWSSLAQLADLPVDVVKVDRSFLVDPADPRRRAVLRSAVELATAVGAECVVEGVETQAQHDLVRSTGARYAQGFLLGRPRPPDPAGSVAAVRPGRALP